MKQQAAGCMPASCPIPSSVVQENRLWIARRKVLNVIPKGPLKIWLTLILPSTHKALGPVGGDSEAKLDQAEADSLDYLGSPPQDMYISLVSAKSSTPTVLPDWIS